MEFETNNKKTSLFKCNLIKKENKVPVYLRKALFLIFSQFCIYSLVTRELIFSMIISRYTKYLRKQRRVVAICT